MRSRKKALIRKWRRLPVRFKKALLARRWKRLGRRSRLLLSQLPHLLPVVPVKRSKELTYRRWQYKWNRRDILEKTDRQLSTKVKRKRLYENPANQALAPKLYKGRARALRAARRKVRLSMHQYRRQASYFQRVRLNHTRRIFKRERTVRRRKNRAIVKYTLQTRRTLRHIIPFLRPRTHRTFSKMVSTRHAGVVRASIRRVLVSKTTARRAFVKNFAVVRQPTRFATWRQAEIKRLSLLQYRRRRHKRQKVARSMRTIQRKHAKKGPMARRRSRRRIKKAVVWYAKKLYGWIRHQRVTRLRAVRLYKRRLPARRRRKTQRVWRWPSARATRLKKIKIVKIQPKVKKHWRHRPQTRGRRKFFRKPSPGVQLRRKIRRRERLANQSRVVRRRKKNAKMMRRRQIRRFRRRYKRVRVLPAEGTKSRRAYVKKFFRRRIAGRRNWLSIVSLKARRAYRLSTKRVLSHTKSSRPVTQLAPFLLRSAVRARVGAYKIRRKRVALRNRRKHRHIRRIRRHGIRWFIRVKWRGWRFQMRREKRHVKRTRRKGRKLQRTRGRNWAFWKRVPRRFLRRRLRLARQVFASHHRLFSRGPWTYFYRDRFVPRPLKKRRKYRAGAKFALTYRTPTRQLILRPRHKQHPRWYTSKVARQALYFALLKKHTKLARLVRRRVRARRGLLGGAVYSLQGASSPKYFTKVVARKNLRRLRGRPRWRRRAKYINRRRRLLPRLLCAQNTASKGLPVNTALSGTRAGRALLSRMPRLLKDRDRASSPAALNKQFTLDLQRELTSTKRFVRRKPDVYKRRLPAVVSKNRSKVRALRVLNHHKMWFARVLVTHQTLKVRLCGKRAMRRPRTRRRVIRSALFEKVLVNSLDNAFSPSPNTRVKTQEQKKLDRAIVKKKAAINAKTQKLPETPSQIWEKARKIIKEILRQAQRAPSVQTVQKTSPTFHKSWSTSALSAPRPKANDSKKKN